MNIKTKEQIAAEVQEVINNSSGTEHYHSYLGGIKLTDGVKGVAEAAGAYWLLDIVASYQCKERVKKCGFQVWELEVSDHGSATVTMKENSGQPILVSQSMPYTDFPLNRFTLWLTNGVLLLPGEY
jgi:hypothetical protein